MRKLLFLLLALPACLMAQSPITITQADMPEPGDTLRYSISDPLGVDYQQTGANQLWDYSTLQPVAQDRDDYVYSLVTPYAFYFLGLNQYGTKIADTIGGGPFVFTDVYNFFRSASGDFRAEGVGFRYQGIPLAAYYSDEDELFQFPLDYGDRDSNSFRFSVDLGNGLYFSEEGYRINEVDGWGTVVTPYDSIACLRVKSTSIAIDSVIFNGFPFAQPNQQITYKFLANGVHIPVLEISGRLQAGQFMPNRVKYRDRYQNLVAAPEALANAIDVFPNPSQGRVIVANQSGRLLTATVTDMQGRICLQGNVGIGQTELQLPATAGVYFLRLLAEDGILAKTQRLIVAQ